MMFTGIRRIHLVGIGGSGMSSIAEVLLKLNYEVSGSDIAESVLIERMREHGANISIGHSASSVKEADVVVFSNAISSRNPERVAASERGIPVIPRAEMLAGLMRMTKYGIAVAGTHGKTSTACIIAEVLRTAKLDPTVIVGGIVSDFGSGGKLGAGEILVAEACESDGSFLELSPTIAVVTTLEREHMDHYASEAELFETFVTFANKVPFYGTVIICLDQPNLQALIPKIKRRLVTYGLTTQSDLMAKNVSFHEFSCKFDVLKRKGHEHERLGSASIESPGLFSVYNALAGIAVGLELGVDFACIADALARFKRAGRRFDLRGTVGDVMVIDDYGHHPTEIRETLRAAKNGFKRRLLVAFQPHRFSRTKDLLSQFFTAFNEADFLVVTPIYAAGETPLEGITGRLISDGVRGMGHRGVVFADRMEEAAGLLVEEARLGDLIMILGAGSIYTIADDVIKQLKTKFEAQSSGGK